MLSTGMIPGITGRSTPRWSQRVDELEVVVRLEEELRDPEVGLGELLRRVAPVALERRGARVRLGVHGDADREVADAPGEADQVDGVLELARGAGRGPSAGRRRGRGRSRSPSPGSGSTISSSSARVCAAHVRCAIAVIDVSWLMCTTRSCVRSRVVPPAPYVTDTYDGCSGSSSRERALELLLRLGGARREELERDRASAGEDVADLGHVDLLVVAGPT